MRQIQPGYPKLDIYSELLKSDAYIEMEKFSNDFLNQNKNNLEYYSKKWVADPFHCWSREWEYSFVYQETKRLVSKKPELKILDAGSGITFFPFLISSKYNNSTVTCVDNDKNLEIIFDRINNNLISFKCSDITNMPFDDNSFDLIYSISVLEHLKKYKKAINEFDRVLNENGMLILTFDVSLYGSADIPIEKSKKVVKYLLKYFEFENISDPIHELEVMDDKNLYCLKSPIEELSLFQKMSSILKNTINNGKFTYNDKLTVFCLSLRNYHK